jgi:hypothetical protein
MRCERGVKFWGNGGRICCANGGLVGLRSFTGAPDAPSSPPGSDVPIPSSRGGDHRAGLPLVHLLRLSLHDLWWTQCAPWPRRASSSSSGEDRGLIFCWLPLDDMGQRMCAVPELGNSSCHEAGVPIGTQS